MEARKWEELPITCLVDVFGRVGVESLLLGVPLVCKSWYEATLSPLCWKQLHIPNMLRYLWLLDTYMNRFGFGIQFRLQEEICTKFVKGVVDRSAGCATMVKLPFCYTEEALTYVADKCPALKKLVLHSVDSPTIIGKFQNLESLEIESGLLFKEIVTEIGAHCPNFVALSLVGPCDIGEEEVLTIVSFLPKLKSLVLRKVFTKRENLIKILKGCPQLVHLDVHGCRGFDENDEEISKLASHIPAFECSGSRSVFDPFGDEENDELSPFASHISINPFGFGDGGDHFDYNYVWNNLNPRFIVVFPL